MALLALPAELVEGLAVAGVASAVSDLSEPGLALAAKMKVGAEQLAVFGSALAVRGKVRRQTVLTARLRVILALRNLPQTQAQRFNQNEALNA